MKGKVFKKILVIGSTTMSLKEPINFMTIFPKVHKMKGLPDDFFLPDYEEIGQFLRFPQAAYAIYQSILNDYTHSKPTKAHHFIKMLHEQGNLRSYLTTSNDLLDRKAGFGPTEYNHVGNLSLGPMCAKCESDYPLENWVSEIQRFNGTSESISKCKECNEPIKPRVNFLNLALKENVFEKLEALTKLSKDCDLIVALDM